MGKKNINMQLVQLKEIWKSISAIEKLQIEKQTEFELLRYKSHDQFLLKQLEHICNNIEQIDQEIQQLRSRLF
jgi:hypothetical protein